MVLDGINKDEILEILENSRVEFHAMLSDEIFLTTISKFPSTVPQSLSWSSETLFSEDFLFPDSSVLVCPNGSVLEPSNKINNLIYTENPKYVFALLATHIKNATDSGSRRITGKIHSSVVMEGSSVVGENVVIGANTVILDNVEIGSNVRIGSNCVIGSPGFGFAKGPDNVYIRIPHVGGVLIGNGVEIGNNVCIDAGTFEPTIIGNSVKIDNLVHIAHNVVVGARTLITACAEISGSVKIGQDVWIAPNVSVIQKVSIGDGALVGIGSTVTKDVPIGLTVFGSPARAVPTRP